MTLKMLFLGGAGMIGSAVAAEALERGDEIAIVTRTEPKRAVDERVHQMRADVRDPRAMRKALAGRQFDVVVNWVGFSPDHIRADVELYGDSVWQYVFISTCSVYGRPVPSLPITESSPRRQPTFGYAKGKVECEEFLEDAYRRRGFPLTIVRPFHTYDRTTVPILSGWTAIDRMRAGKPVIVHGDGTSLWTLMHSGDFARALTPILGNDNAIGESVNVVSGDILTWDRIHVSLAHAAGVRDPQLVHRSSETIAIQWPAWDEVLEYDFRHSMLFDAAKLQRLSPGFAPRVSFSQGAREIIDWFDSDPTRQTVNAELSGAFDRLVGLA